MKVARLHNFNDIRIENIPIPNIGINDALIKTKVCGICSGDVMKWYIEKKAPFVLGHEFTGEISSIGTNVSDFNIGDRIFSHHHAPCLNCNYCNRGDFVQCDVWRNSKIIPGGISEYILIPDINLKNDSLKLPSNISNEDGALIEPVACVIKSLKRANIKSTDTMLVIGLGVMGQIHILLAREFGISKIIGADKVHFRLDKALQLGADYVINVSEENLIQRLRDLTNGLMANIVIVCPNSITAMQVGIKSSARGGSVVFFAPSEPFEKLDLDVNEIYFKDINLITSYSCGPDDTKRSLSFIQKRIITGDKLITHRFNIQETEVAYRLTSQAKDSLKCIILL